MPKFEKCADFGSYSDFGFVSALGFRISDFAMAGLLQQALFSIGVITGF